MRELPIAMTRSDLSGLTWAALEGELDLAGAGLVDGDLHRICDEVPHVVIDTRGLRFIDLAGLRLIAALVRRQHERGARLSLVPGPLVARLARLADMESVLATVEDDPGVLLGLAAAASEDARIPAHHAPDEDSGPLRELVASECMRQHLLVARMVSLTGRAQAALDAVRGTSRAVVAGQARRAATR